MRLWRSLTLAVAAILALPGAALARSADVIDANVHLRLAPDASLLVREDLTFRYDGTFEGSYRDINLKHGERVGDIQVSENGQPLRPGGNTALGSHDQPGVFGATSIADGARIVWHYDASDEDRTWTISYRVIDAAVAYDDVIDVGWAVWGDQWDFDLDRLHADLADPALRPENTDYRIWGHPREVEGETSRDDGIARLEAADVRDGTAVEFRVTVPRAPGRDVSGARPGEGDGLPKILAEEQGLDDDFNSPWQKTKRWIGHHAVLVSLLLTLLALGIVAIMTALTREHSILTPEYLPEPPDDATPALAYGLAHEGEDSSNTALATLLDLVERGYYEAKQATTEDEKLDLALSVAKDRPSEASLEPYERKTLEFFDQLLEDDSVPLSEMRDRIPEHSETWRKRWEAMTGTLNSADEKALGWDRDLNGASLLVALLAAAGFLAVALIYNSVEQKWFLPAAIGVVTVLVIVLTPSTRLKRLSAQYRERASKWSAFERWTEDFPRLRDDPPATLELWKKILVYGVAFGTAERMIKSGRIPEPVVADSQGTWTNYWFTGAVVGSSFDGNSFSSGFASQVAPESSGGGGGFSGGGGGFSGGGGGGSW